MQTEPLDPWAELARFAGGRTNVGGVASFTGVVRDGHLLYVAGDFVYVGPSTGQIARFSDATGTLLPGPVTDDIAGHGRFELTVNARVAGPRLGKAVQDAIKAVKAGGGVLNDDGTLSAGEVVLQPGEYDSKLVAADPAIKILILATSTAGRGPGPLISAIAKEGVGFAGRKLPVTVVPGGGHFFHGQLPLLKQIIVGAWH